jgi:hypothetical protein
MPPLSSVVLVLAKPGVGNQIHEGTGLDTPASAEGVLATGYSGWHAKRCDAFHRLVTPKNVMRRGTSQGTCVGNDDRSFLLLGCNGNQLCLILWPLIRLEEFASGDKIAVCNYFAIRRLRCLLLSGWCLQAQLSQELKTDPQLARLGQWIEASHRQATCTDLSWHRV